MFAPCRFFYNYLEIESTQISTFDDVFTAYSNNDLFPLLALVRGLVDIPWMVSPFEQDRLSKKIFHLTDGLKVEFFETRMNGIHPRQLITYNTGRLALLRNDSDRAYDEFIKSITLCRYGAETIKAMTLLPLSRIHAMGRMDRNLVQTGLNILEMIQTSHNINKSHFKALADPIEIKEALDLVAAQPQIFFPFNYR